MSNAHTPRVMLRTVEPAKVSACQSLEKRWTWAKASAPIRRMMPISTPAQT